MVNAPLQCAEALVSVGSKISVYGPIQMASFSVTGHPAAITPLLPGGIVPVASRYLMGARARACSVAQRIFCRFSDFSVPGWSIISFNHRLCTCASGLRPRCSVGGYYNSLSIHL